MSDVLGMWTVYDHPRDYPNCYVARLFYVGPGDALRATEDIIISPELPALRQLLERRGLTVLPRQAGDDPVIIETWL